MRGTQNPIFISCVHRIPVTARDQQKASHNDKGSDVFPPISASVKTDASRKTDLYLLRMDLRVVTCCDLFVHVDLNSNLSKNCIMLIICLLNCEDDYRLSYPRSICSVTTKQKW